MHKTADFEESKQHLHHLLQGIKTEVLAKLPDSVQHKYVTELAADLEADFDTVVILGEFKRGKSTFLNALLGGNLLPVDVTPTTATINALMWGDEPSFTVHYLNGTIEQFELSQTNLQKFVAGQSFHSDEIKYLKIQLPNELLHHNVVFVDTPGVDDINEQRAEVTYQFIPRADAVLFLLDATSPLRRTEQEFLTDTILKSGLDRIVFVANFMDQLDEEDWEESISEIRHRVSFALDGIQAPVLPFSAADALEARLTNNAELLHQSGYEQLKQVMEGLIKEGSRGEEKIVRFSLRTRQILTSLARELENSIEMRQSSTTVLNNQLENMNDLLRRFGQLAKEMDVYVDDRQAEFLAMIQKSIKHFGDQLKEDSLEALENFTGLNLKDFVEKQLPTMVKKRMKQWIEQYIDSIHKLFQMLEREIAVGLAAEFNTSITKLNVSTGIGNDSLEQHNRLTLSTEDLTNTPIMAGLIAGGAGMLALVLGGPFFLPIVGMAGFPFIQKQMMESKLKRAKEQLKPELSRQMDVLLKQFYLSVEEYVLTHIKAIQTASQQSFEEHIQSVRRSLIENMGKAEQDKEAISDMINEYEKALFYVKTKLEQLTPGTEKGVLVK